MVGGLSDGGVGGWTGGTGNTARARAGKVHVAAKIVCIIECVVVGEWRGEAMRGEGRGGGGGGGDDDAMVLGQWSGRPCPL